MNLEPIKGERKKMEANLLELEIAKSAGKRKNTIQSSGLPGRDMSSRLLNARTLLVVRRLVILSGTDCCVMEHVTILMGKEKARKKERKKEKNSQK
jgi:hypothetical protein